MSWEVLALAAIGMVAAYAAGRVEGAAQARADEIERRGEELQEATERLVERLEELENGGE